MCMFQEIFHHFYYIMAFSRNNLVKTIKHTKSNPNSKRFWPHCDFTYYICSTIFFILSCSFDHALTSSGSVLVPANLRAVQ